MKGSFSISRKKFIKWIGFIFLIPFYILVNLIVDKQIEIESRKKKILISNTIPEGITLLGSIIVIKNRGGVKVFSARCTHLGCQINTVENNVMVCQCHGSRFDITGRPINGPASKNLEELPIQKDYKTGEIFVYAL